MFYVTLMIPKQMETQSSLLYSQENFVILFPCGNHIGIELEYTVGREGDSTFSKWAQAPYAKWAGSSILADRHLQKYQRYTA